ncbi:hypothetical protein BH23GEM11_BH23GEM11_13760 [soil metagenome]
MLPASVRSALRPVSSGRSGSRHRPARPVLPFLAAFALAITVGTQALAAQARPAAPLQDAFFAWDEGRYIESMEGYLGALRGPGGESLRREAALLTGELHPVRELDDDGRVLRVSPDGNWVAWARNVGGSWETRIEPAAGGASGPGGASGTGARIVVPAQQASLSAGGSAGGSAGAKVAWIDEPEGGARSLVIRDLSSERETRVELGEMRVQSHAFQPDAEVLVLAAAPDTGSDRIALYRATGPEWRPEAVTLSVELPVLTNPVPAAGGRVVMFTVPARSPYSAAAATATATGGHGLGVVDLETGRVLRIVGTNPTLARDGSRMAWYVPSTPQGPGATAAAAGRPDSGRIQTLDLSAGVPASEAAIRTVIETTLRLGDPALSPDGARVAFKAMPSVTWEIFLVDAEASDALDPGTAADPPEGITRVTREVQHDQFPEWIDDRRLLALKGEARHRRSYLYDLETGEHYRLFHNNTLRTIAPEYEWVVSPDGRSLLVSAERDGNTISPERGVFRIDLGAEVTMDALTRRLEANLAYEQDLQAEGEARFAPIHDEVARVAGAVQAGRVHNHADQLYRMGSKFIGQPGNLEATEYLRETLEGWGYEVTVEWFEPRGMRAANVIARLPGTENPELIYAISSHFDSVLPSPGADDNSSGTTALLEAARVLAENPRKATIEFAFLTAEEAGLLGAREYVRRMVEEGRQLVGVLNNDMIGWTRSHRLDNTIRYSNPGIMRIQHGAAMRYSELITYDALYYRGTDGAVFYEAYGDIVGGIGSYPVLGNPNYHQRTDQVETINHRLVAEVSRTTVASIMLLADSPSRLGELRVENRSGSGTDVAWEPALEAGVTGYRVQVRRAGGEVRELGVTSDPRFSLADVRAGDVIEVRAIGAGGLEGWDWARVELP